MIDRPMTSRAATIFANLLRNFPGKTIVVLSADGLREFPQFAKLRGEVVGYWGNVSPVVKWPGRKRTWHGHPGFLRVWSRPEAVRNEKERVN